jgi:hypothetical protein
MKQFSKPTRLVLGLLGFAIASGGFLLNLETGIFGLKDLPSFFSAIVFFSWISTIAKFVKSAWYLNPLFLIVLIIVSFFIPLSNANRWVGLFVLTTCSIILHFKEIDVRKFLRTNLQLTIILLLLKSLFSVLSRVPEYIIQFLSFGYDNAFHFAIYRYYRAEPWFPFGTQAPWGTDFGLFKTYPSGQSAFWSFLAEPLIGDSLESEKNLVVYAVINVVILVVLNFLIFRLILPYSQKRMMDLIFIGFVSSVISFGYFGIFFTNGFIPYAAGILILLIYLVVQSLDLSRTSRYLSVFFATLLLLLVSPSLIAFLVLPGLVTTFRYLKEAFSSGSYIRAVFMLFISATLALLGYFFQVITSSNFGWRVILSPGGVIKPNVYVALLLFLSITIALAFRWRFIFNTLEIQLVLSGALSVGLLSAITIMFTGSVQYYAVKQLHVWLVLAGVGVAIIFISLKSFPKISNFLRVSFVLLLIVPLMTPTSIRSAWMGNMIGVISTTLDKSKWNSQIVNVASIEAGLKAVNSLKNVSTECLILRTKELESDLNSRWINSLNINPTITNNCFAAFWNSAPLTAEELEMRLRELEGTFLILTDTGAELKAEKESNFQYVLLP